VPRVLPCPMRPGGYPACPSCYLLNAPRPLPARLTLRPPSRPAQKVTRRALALPCPMRSGGYPARPSCYPTQCALEVTRRVPSITLPNLSGPLDLPWATRPRSLPTTALLLPGSTSRLLATHARLLTLRTLCLGPKTTGRHPVAPGEGARGALQVRKAAR
jgi:hypothetical protein